MKANSILTLALLSALTSGAFAQGSLVPPAGPPAASMKTLDQVEARRPIQSLAAAAPYTITQSGSYYLTGNITVATDISAIIVANGVNDVSIDLNGFTISSTLATAGTTSAISFGQSARISISNGNLKSGSVVSPAGGITKAGFRNGIASSSTLTESTISGVNVTGMHEEGLVLYDNSIVEKCTFSHCSTGMHNSGGITRQCTADRCENIGLTSHTVEFCRGTGFRGNGIDCTIANNSSGFSTSGIGLATVVLASNCVGRSENHTGLTSRNATDCYGVSTTGTGINATSATNCIGIGATYGLNIFGTANSCQGTSGAGGVALKAAIAIGCTFTGGTLDVPLAKRFNM